MSGGIDPGRVRLRLVITGGCVGAVSVASERPLVSQALRGRPADDAAQLVPLLFALCGKAQGRAAVMAVAAARGHGEAVHLDPAIQAEALREHLWRWLLDLPPLLGEAPLHAEFVAGAGWIAAGQRAELAALLDNSRIHALCHRLTVADDVADVALRGLPALDAQGSLALWPQLDEGFCRRPEWHGQPAETGALARRQGGAGGLKGAFGARWLARLEELQEWANGREKVGAGGTASAVQAAVGRGRALVETARGLLMHELVLDGERIADYFIVAPTEWNFHPQGPLVHWLTGRDAGELTALKAFVGCAVAALDPCVPWELELR